MSVVISDAWRQRFGGTARLYGENAPEFLPNRTFAWSGLAG